MLGRLWRWFVDTGDKQELHVHVHLHDHQNSVSASCTTRENDRHDDELVSSQRRTSVQQRTSVDEATSDEVASVMLAGGLAKAVDRTSGGTTKREGTGVDRQIQSLRRNLKRE